MIPLYVATAELPPMTQRPLHGAWPMISLYVAIAVL